MLRPLSLALILLLLASCALRNEPEVMLPEDFKSPEVVQQDEAPAVFKSKETKHADQCIARRYKILYRTDWRYRRFLWHIERFVEKMSESEREAAWLCHEARESEENFDSIGAAAFYHEGIHRLGSFSEFTFFTNRDNTGFTKLVYSREPGLRPIFEIADELNAYRESFQLGLDLKSPSLQKQARENMASQLKKLKRLYSSSKKQICENSGLKQFLAEQVREIQKSVIKTSKKFSICN